VPGCSIALVLIGVVCLTSVMSYLQEGASAKAMSAFKVSANP
jgi:hypothetical protein